MVRRWRGLPIAASIVAHVAIFAWIASRMEKMPALFAPARATELVVARVVDQAPPAPQTSTSKASPAPTGDEHGPRATHPPRRSRGGSVGPAVQQGESARSTADEGSVTVPASPRDPSSVDLSLKPVAPSTDDPSRIVQGEPFPGGRSGAIDLHPNGGGGLVHRDTEFIGKIDHEGNLDFEGHYEGPELGAGSGGRPSVSFPMDMTDTFLRLAGEDPYAYEKMKMMKATQGLRAEMADAACTEHLKESLSDIRPRLESIWKRKRLSMEEKRKLIFKLWDECVEDGSPEIVQTADMIRASVVAFIKEKMPAASVYAYSEIDLVALNGQRHSKQAFAPYQ